MTDDTHARTHACINTHIYVDTEIHTDTHTENYLTKLDLDSSIFFF